MGKTVAEGEDIKVSIAEIKSDDVNATPCERLTNVMTRSVEDMANGGIEPGDIMSAMIGTMLTFGFRYGFDVGGMKKVFQYQIDHIDQMYADMRLYLSRAGGSA